MNASLRAGGKSEERNVYDDDDYGDDRLSGSREWDDCDAKLSESELGYVGLYNKSKSGRAKEEMSFNVSVM